MIFIVDRCIAPESCFSESTSRSCLNCLRPTVNSQGSPLANDGHTMPALASSSFTSLSAFLCRSSANSSPEKCTHSSSWHGATAGWVGHQILSGQKEGPKRLSQLETSSNLSQAIAGWAPSAWFRSGAIPFETGLELELIHLIVSPFLFTWEYCFLVFVVL